jgi:hypothetical protein
LTQAKNSKIIALSGTPIVNQPVEIGIMANLLHGYFHCVEDTVTTTDDRKITQLQTILKNHPRVNFYSIQKSTGVSTVFFTILQTGYIKLFREGTNELEGTMYVGPEEATPATIQELYAEIKTEFQTAGVAMTGKPAYKALPLLPPTQEEFNNEFIDSLNLKVKDRITFVKRMSGLVSYYRGSKEELMPKVVNDTIVECKLSSVALPQYEKARLKEIETDKNKKSSKQSAFGEAMELVQSESSSYRFRSRALCNFAFPTDIERPFPAKQSDLDDAVGDGRPLLGDTPIDIGDDAVSVVEAEAAEKATTAEDKEGEDEEAPLFEEEGAMVKRILPYKERLENALEALNARKDTIFRMDPTAPASDQLATYSSKFAAIYERIMASPGSSLVYSNFKTVEGIGVLAMALDANGFAPIKLTGPENDLEFSEETLASFAENPDQPRYILYSGDASIRERQTLINLFNYKRASGKLPQKMRDVLESSYLADTGNLLGEICKVFMITGAGAEGLSLRNVRTVHIMEPYWNKVRTDQVKGRAVRICSHSDLPYSENPSENQRTVEVFTYVAVFDPAVPPNQTIIVQDDSKTSDQYILGLADAKEAVSSDILKLLKDGAVDCQINKFENEEGIQCFDFDTQGATIGDFLYDPRLREDKAMTEQQFRVQAATIKEEAQMGETVKYKGALYQLLTEKASGRILIYDIKDIKFKAPIGEVLVDPVTLKKKSIRWFEVPGVLPAPTTGSAVPLAPPPKPVVAASAAAPPPPSIFSAPPKITKPSNELYIRAYLDEIDAPKKEVERVLALFEENQDGAWSILEKELEAGSGRENSNTMLADINKEEIFKYYKDKWSKGNLPSPIVANEMAPPSNVYVNKEKIVRKGTVKNAKNIILYNLKQHVYNFYREIGASEEQINKVNELVNKYKLGIWDALESIAEKRGYPIPTIRKHKAEFEANKYKA